MRCQEIRASRVIALMLQLGVKSARDMSLEDASKQERRMRRAVETTGIAMGPAALATRDLKRRRAKVTHPSKR